MEYKNLTDIEEKKLSPTELNNYYNEVIKYYQSLPYNETGNKIRETLHPLILRLMKLSQKLTINQNNVISHINQPVIYAINHTNIHDIPITCNVIKDHAVVLVENGVEHHDLSGFVLKLNGAIFIDRKDKKDRNRAKNDIIKTLLNGKNIIMFPEGTWNMSDNLIMLPLNWGIIEIAKKTNCPIVPIILEYNNYDEVYANVGKPIKINKTDDKTTSINYLRDQMATMRWDFWEKFDKLSRENLSPDYYNNLKQYYLNEYKKLNVAYEQSIIYKPYDDINDIYQHLNNININTNNAFLLRNDENKKIFIK